jgi:hypothetical protein
VPCRTVCALALLAWLCAAPGAGQAQSRGAAGGATPNIGVVLMGRFAAFSAPTEFAFPGVPLDDEFRVGPEGFNLGPVEFDIYGNVDPYLFGRVRLSLTDRGISAEEAFVQTTALPLGATAKFGRFKSGIGYLNAVHRHADDFIEAPLPYLAFLGGQYGDEGAQVRWLAPTVVFWEFGVESLRGAAYPAGGTRPEAAAAAFMSVGSDIGDSQSWLAGLSRLQTRTRDRQAVSPSGMAYGYAGETAVNILHWVWKWAPDGNPRYTDLKLQGEYLLREEDGQYTLTDPLAGAQTLDLRGVNAAQQAGWYQQARWKFLERWRVGLRQSVLAPQQTARTGAATALLGRDRALTVSSAMLEFDPSEFSFFRLQYSRDDTDRAAGVNRWYLQYTIALGAHAAHEY